MTSKTVVESSKTDNTPWAPAQEGILKGLKASTDTYDANQPMLQRFASEQQGTYGRVAPGAEQGVSGAQSLVNRNLGGGNLNGNPFLEGIIAKTRSGVIDGVNDQFGPAGRFGSGMHAKILADSLSEAENGLRYQNYGQERGYQQDAIGQSQDLMRGSQSLLDNAAQLPWIGVGAMNGNVRQASAGYGTTTSNSRRQESGSALDAITGIGGLGLKAFSTLKPSDDRIKENKRPVGMMAGGVPVQEYNFKGDPTPRMGVMASDVAAIRPDALGPQVGGIQTVDYGKLGPEGALLSRSAGPVGMGENPMMPEMPRVQSNWEKPGGTREKLDEFADMLLAYSGNPLGVAGMNARAGARQSEAEESRYQSRRADDDATWQRRQEYERNNPKPVQPSEFEANNGDRYRMGPNGQPVKIFSDPTPKVNWVEADDGRGGKRLIPFVNGQPMGQGGQGPAPGAVVADPRKAGGATGNRSGNFR